MKLRIRLSEKAPFIILVAIIALASVVLAFAQDQRIAEEAEVRADLAQAQAQLAALPDGVRLAPIAADTGPDLGDEPLDTAALFPVFILIGGMVLALLVFVAFYTLWRSRQAEEIISTEQRLSLARSKERLRSIFENAGDGICGLNMGGKIIFSNPAAASILDAQSDALQGERLSRLLGQGSNHQWLDTDNDTPAHSELTLTTPGGRNLVVELTATPMRNHSGEISGSVIIFRDVTQRVETLRELREANAEAEEFAYRTSHDLRSPLVSTLALMKIIGQNLEKGRVEAASKAVGLSVAALEGLERLVEDIQDLSRTKSESEDIAVIDLAEQAHGALERHTYLEGYEKLSIETDFQSSADLSSKPRRVRLIVNNLISNAIKYYDPARPDPAIRISTYPKENGILLTVEDNGLGIPEDQREHLFSMFKRFHPNVSFGSGLGLYMVKKSAEIIGAQVGYEPCDAGSRFTVFFPVKQANVETKAEHAA